MKEQEGNIHFTVIENGAVTQIQTREREYRNLMVLLNDQVFPENFGECGGQGRCGTCVVRISGQAAATGVFFERNEKATLGKSGITAENARLSCQVLVTPELNNLVIEIEASGNY